MNVPKKSIKKNRSQGRKVRRIKKVIVTASIFKYRSAINTPHDGRQDDSSLIVSIRDSYSKSDYGNIQLRCLKRRKYPKQRKKENYVVTRRGPDYNNIAEEYI